MQESKQLVQENNQDSNQPVNQPMKENKMGTMDVKKLIITMSLPIMISMLVQALYNVVDSIFVAQIGENALTAVSLAFPLQNMMIAVSTGTGVGINAMLSRALGEKKFDRSDAAANNGVFLAFCSALVFVLIGIFGTDPFIHTQTNAKEIVRLGDSYLSIVCCFCFGLFFQVTFERLLQATGRTMLSMISQLCGALINIILDPIMIFGLLGCPKMGVAGAAYATVIGQTIAAIIALILNVKLNKELHFSLSCVLHPELKVIGRIYAVGIPSILMMSIGSVMTYLMNRILLGFSTTAAAVFGVYFKLQSFFFMPVFGMNNGLIPILAYNLGAQKKKRIDEALRFAIFLAFCIMTVGTLTFELVPGLLLKLFNASDDMTTIGMAALRIIAIHFPLAAVGIALGSVFQAFSRSIYSLMVSLGRQLVILIPVAWLLSLTGEVTNVWWSFPIAEVVSLALTLTFFRKIYREDVATIE